MFIDTVKENFDVNQPIFTEDFLDLFAEYSRAYVFRLLKKAEQNGDITKFANGVYYLPKKTFFGLSTITADSVIERKYLNWNNDIYGVYSGLKLLNMFSVTEQVPNVVELVTNNESTRGRTIILDGRKFILKKSRTTIDCDNADAYTVLQLFTDISITTEISNFSKQKLIEFIRTKNIGQNRLLTLALHFPTRTVKNLIGSGILDVIA